MELYKDSGFKMTGASIDLPVHSVDELIIKLKLKNRIKLSESDFDALKKDINKNDPKDPKWYLVIKYRIKDEELINKILG